jgi:hypothetical protein
MSEIIENCKSFGHVRYWSGRLWWEEDSTYFYRGCNALIQGGAADMLSIAAIRVSEWCKKQDHPEDYHLVNLVHDEVIFEIPEDQVDRCIAELEPIMQVSDLFGIPFTVESKTGPTYGDIVKKGKSLEDYEAKKQSFVDAEEDEVEE